MKINIVNLRKWNQKLQKLWNNVSLKQKKKKQQQIKVINKLI